MAIPKDLLSTKKDITRVNLEQIEEGGFFHASESLVGEHFCSRLKTD